MRDQQGGHPHAFQHLGELDAQARAQRDVERRQRLVEQQQVRARRQCPGQGDALALAARQVARQRIAQGPQVESVEQRLDVRQVGRRGAMAEPAHAEALASTVSKRLLAPGGLSTTEYASDQQWDQPNGWAALQWMAVRGFADYGQTGLAQDIAHRWLATVAAVYEREGKLVEKYALRQREHEVSAGGSGGEYPLQDGFGWTNGVTRALLDAYLQHTAHGCVAYAKTPVHR